MPIVRRRYLTDRNGVEHEITSKEVLQRILDQMTPEERALWEARYRFCHVDIDLGDFLSYSGTLRDLQ